MIALLGTMLLAAANTVVAAPGAAKAAAAKVPAAAATLSPQVLQQLQNFQFANKSPLQQNAPWLTHIFAGCFLVLAVGLVLLLAVQTTKQEGLSGTIGGRVESAYRPRLGFDQQLARLTSYVAIGMVFFAVVLSITGNLSALALLEVKDLRVGFKTDDGFVEAVNGLTYSVDSGSTLGIVGESGSGKSVNALSIMRLIPMPPGRIEGGSISLRGQNLLAKTEPEMRKIRGKDIAMIFQDPMTSLNPVLTVGEQIMESVQIHLKMSKKDALAKTIDMLRLVKIPLPEKRVREYPHQLSGGMRQRVMIAMALACDPDVLIADEPTTALDVTIQAQIIELMNEMQQRLGSAIVMITHDLGVVAETCRYVLVMYAGNMVEYGTAQQIFAQPKHPYTMGLLASLPRLDDKEQTRLVPIEGQPPNLLRLPTGCAFAPRCRYRMPICDTPVPSYDFGEGHLARCFLYDERTEKERTLAVETAPKAAAQAVAP